MTLIKSQNIRKNFNGAKTNVATAATDAAATAVAIAASTRSCFISLACSIGSFSLACGSFLQIPNTTDRISYQRGLLLTSLGFIYFSSLTDCCNKYLLETKHGRKFRKKYRLMMSDVMDMTNKIVSAVQATFSFFVGYVVCKSTCNKSFVYASHCLMEGYGWFGTAYFMYDIWSMYKVHTQKITDKLKLMRLTSHASFMPKITAGNKNGGLYDKYIAQTFAANGQRLNKIQTIGTENVQQPEEENTYDDDNNLQQHEQHQMHCHNHYHHEDEIYDYDGESVPISENGKCSFLRYILTHPVMMIHHLFVGTIGFLVVTYIRGGGHCIYSYMFMMEFSTPFVSLRSILSTLGLKNTRFYLINGLVMLFSFLVCRVLMWPYVMWRYSWEIKAPSIWHAITGLPIGCIIGILILFLPQLYWFYLMVKGALKVFFPSCSTASSTSSSSTSPLSLLPPMVTAPNTKLIDSTCCDNGITNGNTITTKTNGIALGHIMHE